MRTVRSTLALLLVIGFTSVAIAQQQKAADFSLKSVDGVSHQLSKYKGKVVVVNFWATWCGPCRQEIPDFIEAYKKYKSKGLEIIGISLDQDGWKRVVPFVKQNLITYTIVMGDEKTVHNYGDINAIPTTFIVDKKGDIAYQQVGVMTLKDLEAKLKPLL